MPLETQILLSGMFLTISGCLEYPIRLTIHAKHLVFNEFFFVIGFTFFQDNKVHAWFKFLYI